MERRLSLMNTDALEPFDFDEIFDELWPICRSITGDGLRQSLKILQRVVPIETREYETGLRCFDWEVPLEWNICEAWIKSRDGRVLVDFADNNLHVLNYSLPKKGVVSKDELFKHIHSRPDLPDAIPYRTCYYAPDWGFCVEHARLSEFQDDTYEILIDSTLKPGALTIGEIRHQGESNAEIVFTTYLCHPSMANNELSGPLVQTELFKRLQRRSRTRYSYRFVYAPETIGDIVFLSQNSIALKENMVGGAVLTMLGNDSPMMFEPSGRQDSIFDRAARNVLEHRYPSSSIGRRNPKGRAAQRQYCSPGLKLPLSVLSRALGGSYPEYHTSLDTKSVIHPDRHRQAVQILDDIIDVIEHNDKFINQRPFGEPFMSKYDLGTRFGSERIQPQKLYYKFLLQMSDGDADMLDIATELNICMLDLLTAAQDLVAAGLLSPARSTCNPL